MALKPKSRVANNLVKSENGIYTGTIIAARLGTGVKKEKNGRDIEQIEYERFELIIDFEGTGSPIQIKTYTGNILNSEPVETINAGRGTKNEVAIYNRYTTALLKLNLVTLDQLPTIDDDGLLKIEKNFENLTGKKVNCAVGKNKEGFFAIDLQTLKLID